MSKNFALSICQALPFPSKQDSMFDMLRESLAKPILRKLGFEVHRIKYRNARFSLTDANSLAFEALRRAAIRNAANDDSIVIIGAHDLVSFDSIAGYLLHSSAQIVMFEPRSLSCEKLRANLLDFNLRNCAVIQKAIHQSLSECTLFEIDPKYLDSYPDWAEGIASFSKQHVLKTAHNAHIKEETVPCSNPDMWYSDYNISSIAYLQIDAEGFDYEILKSINLCAFAPIAIMLEYANLSFPDQSECLSYLHLHGYDTISNGEDVLAVDISRLIS